MDTAFMRTMTKPGGFADSCRRFLVASNATLMIFTTGIVAVGLVLKSGTFLTEDVLRPVFEKITASMNLADVDEMGFEDYDFASICSGIGVGIVALGLASSGMCLFGMIAAKVYLFPVCLGYCGILVLVILTQIAFVMAITIRRPLIDDWIKPVLQDSLRQSYKGFNGTDTTTQTWNLVMFTMKCCGVEGYSDFNRAVKWYRQLFQDGWWFTMSTPILCCNFDVKVPGDFSCAVNPSPDSSNYRKFNAVCSSFSYITAVSAPIHVSLAYPHPYLHNILSKPLATFSHKSEGCYDAIWDELYQNKLYVIMAGAVIFMAQIALLFAAIIHTKASYNKRKVDDNIKNEERTPDGSSRQFERQNGNKSIADLISSTAGILSQTSNPDVPPDMRNLMDQSLAGSMFGVHGHGQGCNMPFMVNSGRPVNALEQLMQNFQMQGRFNTHNDMFNPLNVFTAAFMNPFTGGIRVDNQFEDITNDVIQQRHMQQMPYGENPPSNQLALRFPSRNQRLMRLTSERSLKGLPGVINDSPISIRRDSIELATYTREMTSDGTSEGRPMGHGCDETLDE